MLLEEVQQELRSSQDPQVEDLGGLDVLTAHLDRLVNDLYADRVVRAFVTTSSPLPSSAVTFVMNVLGQNPFPFVVAAAAQGAADLALGQRDRRQLQRRMLERVRERNSLPEAEMASECLAGAYLFADLPGGSRPALLAALDEIETGEPPLLVRRAALLAGLAWLWSGSPDLECILARLRDDPEAGAQAQYELGLIALDRALQAGDQQRMLLGVKHAADQFAKAHAAGPELLEANAFAKVLSAITLFCSNDVRDLEDLLAEASRTASERAADLDQMSLRPWLRPRVDAERSWWAIASALQGLSLDLSQRSWLRAVPVLEQIARLRRALVPAATAAGDGLRETITEKIAESFLRQEGLRSHLTAWLDDAFISADDHAEASALLRAVEQGSLRRRHLEQASPSSSHDAGNDSEPLVRRRASALTALAGSSPLTAPLERAFAAMDRSLDGHVDYAGDVRTDTRFLIQYLMAFLSHSLDVAPAMAKGLFDFLFETDGAKPLEVQLQRTCWHFLRLQTNGFAQHQVLREAADVASGRADIAIARPSWRMVLEIKRELRDASRKGIRKYLGQAASYTLTGPRIGFLMVLDLVSQRGWALTLEDNCWVESVQTEGDSQPRLICVWRVPGARRPPNETATPIQ